MNYACNESCNTMNYAMQWIMQLNKLHFGIKYAVK